MKKILTLLSIAIVLISCNTSEKKKTTTEARVSEVKSEPQNPELKASMTRGKDIYVDFCVSCHLPNGKGVTKVFPPLANSDYLKKYREESIKSIKYGQSGEITVNGITYNGVMAPLGLENDEIADVMNYITNTWGNSNTKLITEQEVSEIEQ